MWNRVDGDLAREFTDGMASHAISNNKQMTALLPCFLIGSQLHDARILIVLTSETDVSQCGVSNLLFPEHCNLQLRPAQSF